MAFLHELRMLSAIVTAPCAHKPTTLPSSPSKLETGRACELPPVLGHCWPGWGSCTPSVTQAENSGTKAAYFFAQPSARVSFCTTPLASRRCWGHTLSEALGLLPLQASVPCVGRGHGRGQPLPDISTLTPWPAGPGSSLCWKLITQPVLAFSWSSPRPDKHREVRGQAPKQGGREGSVTLFVSWHQFGLWLQVDSETTSTKGLPARFQEIPSVTGTTSSSIDLVSQIILSFPILWGN